MLPGDTVRYPNTWTHWGNEAVYGMTFAEREPLRHRYPHGPYSMIGPVEVTGAMPGDVIECTPLALRTIDWGWNSFPLGAGALPPAGDQPTSAILAGHYGGNLVLRDLHVGSSIFLPVAKPGGRIWIGDVHALQGDGVVDQTAIETAAENLEIRYDLRRQVGLRGPLAETADSWILIGFADDLDDALTCHPRSDPAVAASRAAGHAMTLSPADRLDILDLLTRADTAASARDIEGYLRLLTADTVLDGDQGTYRGTSALRNALAAVWSAEPKASLHLTLNPVIDASGQPGGAVARSVLLIINPGPPPALAATARITQDLRQEDGQWKISRRTVST